MIFISKLTFISFLQIVISSLLNFYIKLLTLLFTYAFSTFSEKVENYMKYLPKCLWLCLCISHRTYTNIGPFVRIISKHLILGGKFSVIYPTCFSELVSCKTLPNSPQPSPVSSMSLGCESSFRLLEQQQIGWFKQQLISHSFEGWEAQDQSISGF